MSFSVIKPAPQRVEAKENAIAIEWSDGHKSQYLPRDLRLACRCASCVDEHTHVRLIQPDRIAPDIRARAIVPIGNYAFTIYWSDGHSTGIYTYDHLRELCGCAECRSPRSFHV